MGIANEHEIHKRRLGRNMGIGIVLGTFVILVYALTVAKIGDELLGLSAAQQGQAPQSESSQ
jgi:hypothetical protein